MVVSKSKGGADRGGCIKVLGRGRRGWLYQSLREGQTGVVVSKS